MSSRIFIIATGPDVRTVREIAKRQLIQDGLQIVELSRLGEQAKKSEEAKAKATALGQKIVGQYSQSDWGARAQRLLYVIQQGIPTYGNTQE